MQIIKKMRKQKAVYWKRRVDENGDPSPDSFGNFTYENPVEIRCRWEDKEGQFRDQNNEIQHFNSTVYVDRTMDVGDRLKLGEMESDVAINPTDTDSKEIVGFEDIPTLNAKKHLYIAHL